MSRGQRDKIKTLQRRADWLEERLEGRDDLSVSFDRSELSALKWAIGILKTLFNDADKRSPVDATM